MKDTRKHTKTVWWKVLLLGILYYIWIRHTGKSIPCLFYEIFHLKCPGCGITHMMLYLSCFQWKCAMRQNYVLFFTIPLIALCLFYEMVWKKRKKSYNRFFQVLEAGYILLLVVWTIVRNILSI